LIPSSSERYPSMLPLAAYRKNKGAARSISEKIAATAAEL
jgi:hypothetical protein